MSVKIVVHPGFHKTGTTSLQRGALGLRDVLDSRLRMMFTADVRDAVQVARRYSVHPDSRRLAVFSRAFAANIATIDRLDSRPLLITAEALVGQIPGRKNVETYGAAPALLECVVAELHDVFGGDASITVCFTCRDPENWKRSVYYQNLRSTRITDDFETYWEKYNQAAKLEEIVSLTRTQLLGLATVTSIWIEEYRDMPLSSLGPILDLLNVKRDDLSAITPQNVQPPNAALHLLELNRSSLSDEKLSVAKRRLLRLYRKSGQASCLPF